MIYSFIIFFFCFSVSAQSPVPPETLKQIEQKLNSVKALKARFIQTDSSQHILSGNFYLARPFKVRFEYDDPAPYLIVGQGESLVYEDYTTNNVTFFPTESILPPLLMKENITLGKDIKILKNWQDKDLVFLLAINEAGGEVLFEFDAKTGSLKGWRTHDPFGEKIKITLLRVEENIHLDDALFQYNRTNSKRKRLPHI